MLEAGEGTLLWADINAHGGRNGIGIWEGGHGGKSEKVAWASCQAHSDTNLVECAHCTAIAKDLAVRDRMPVAQLQLSIWKDLPTSLKGKLEVPAWAGSGGIPIREGKSAK
jgi:hypothetical protein